MAVKRWVGGASGATGDVSVSANWSPSGVPTGGDTVYFDGAGQSTIYDVDAGLSGSNTLSGVALAAVYIMDTFTGKIGTSSTPLAINPGDLFIHFPSGQSSVTGSQRINLDLEAVQCDVVISGSASQGIDTGLPPITIVGTNASNTLSITGRALVGIAARDGSEAATFTTVNTAQDVTGSAPTVQLGAGCTLTTLELGAGTVTNRGANVTTATIDGATYRANGAATHTTIDLRSGTLQYNSSGTITNLTVADGASADFSKDPRAKTITNTTIYPGATLNLNNGNPFSVTLTNDIDIVGGSLQDVTLNAWRNTTVALSTIS